jgi:hypothetical protein
VRNVAPHIPRASRAEQIARRRLVVARVDMDPLPHCSAALSHPHPGLSELRVASTNTLL